MRTVVRLSGKRVILQRMEHGFFKLKVKQLVSETSDAKTVYLDIPNPHKEIFTYKPGQYLTFRIHLNGEEVRRSYSLCTNPGTDAIPAVTVKKVDLGKMSGFMNDVLKEGDEIEVMPPNGKFFVEVNPNATNNYILFGGGSGITPLFGITKAVLNHEPGSRVWLIYANRNADSVIFKNELALLEKQFNGRFKVFLSYDQAPLTWFGLKGFLTEEKISNILSSKIGPVANNSHYYICGPSPMMDIVKKGLAKTGVSQDKIHTEYFAAPVSSTPKEAPKTEESEVFKGVAHVKVKVYGKHHELNVDQNTTILDAAIKGGLEPPYSCTVGVCTTCRAKVHLGKVHMKEREGLTDDEIESGYILTCQSLPRSAEIDLSYE